MTFILSNITNWLTDSQSSESSVGADAKSSEQSDEWVTATASSYTNAEKCENDIASFGDSGTFAEEDIDDDIPGISQVVNSAMEWGGYLLHYGKETGKIVTRSAMMQIKSALQENVVPEELNTEKLTTGVATAPWIGLSEEKLMKQRILSISEDKRNFLRGPPAGVQYHFDYAVSYPVAMVMLDEDANLKAMRFELVPKQLKEETFWRNYFYHVALMKQSAELVSHAKHRAQDVDSSQTTHISEPSADTDLVFVADTFTASDDIVCVAASNHSGKASTKSNPQNDELQDFEIVEIADCGGTAINAT